MMKNSLKQHLCYFHPDLGNKIALYFGHCFNSGLKSHAFLYYDLLVYPCERHQHWFSVIPRWDVDALLQRGNFNLKLSGRLFLPF